MRVLVYYAAWIALSAVLLTAVEQAFASHERLLAIAAAFVWHGALNALERWKPTFLAGGRPFAKEKA